MGLVVGAGNKKSRTTVLALVLGASISGVIASIGVAFAGEFSSRSNAIGSAYAVSIVAVTVSIMLSSFESQRVSLLAGITAGTAAVLLLGVLTFGLMFLPSLIFWGFATYLQVRSTSSDSLELVTAVLWGIGISLLGTLLIAAAADAASL